MKWTLEESKKVFDEDQDERAKIAMIRYESRLDAYQSCKGSLKFPCWKRIS